MISKGIATFTLDLGKAPRWLFERMVKLGREMIQVIIAEEGSDSFIKRLSDPVWFQSLGTVLAFDWNASGLTTILTAALKEAIRGSERDLGIFICGGKGKTSRKTPQEITQWGNLLNFSPAKSQSLVYNSKMSAKVDSALIQDGFQIYHHVFIFSKNGAWTVIQQGMNTENQTARRYHWHSQKARDLINEPHTGISSQLLLNNTLNLTASQSAKNRDISAELVNRNNFTSLKKDLILLNRYSTPLSQMAEIKQGQQVLKLVNLENKEFKYHPVVQENFFQSKYLHKILWDLCDRKPANYEKMLASPGVGAKTVRALALVAEVIYGAKPSYEDPARYSFAHGGKDGTPYFVDRKTYDQTIQTMNEYVLKSSLPKLEKQKVLNKFG